MPHTPTPTPTPCFACHNDDDDDHPGVVKLRNYYRYWRHQVMRGTILESRLVPLMQRHCDDARVTWPVLCEWSVETAIEHFRSHERIVVPRALPFYDFNARLDFKR